MPDFVIYQFQVDLPDHVLQIARITFPTVSINYFSSIFTAVEMERIDTRFSHFQSPLCRSGIQRNAHGDEQAGSGRTQSRKFIFNARFVGQLYHPAHGYQIHILLEIIFS